MFSHSPFDEALSRPFMADDMSLTKEKKRFSWTKSVASTVFTIDDDDVTYETYEAPLEVIPLCSSLDIPMATDPMVPLTTLKYQVSMDVSEITTDLEQAVLQERHSDIEEICMDMKKLHGIQQDFAEIVDTQDYDIKRMSWLAIEAFEETECGLEELETAHSMMSLNRTRKETIVRTAVAVGFMVMTIAWALGKLYDGGHIHADSGDPQKFP
jgi:hypothetical protein